MGVTLKSGSQSNSAIFMNRICQLLSVLAPRWAALLGIDHSANAATTRILALGASNTNGVGVSTSEAWPAQLERMLRAEGHDATVTVNAVNGQTSAGVLARTSQIPSGTQVVVFDSGGDNDQEHGMSMAETNANIAGIAAAIHAHGAAPIRAPYKPIAGQMYVGDIGHPVDCHHLTTQSHAHVAAALVPLVLAAVKGRN